MDILAINNNALLSSKTIIIVDNGSSWVDSTVKLRQIAQMLGDRLKQQVHAVSLQHANHISKVDIKEKLDDIPVQIFRKFLQIQLSQGKQDFIVIPLFFGISNALTSFIPAEVASLKEEFSSFDLSLAEPLYPLPKGDDDIIEILYQHTLKILKGKNDNLVIVDHGSPKATVTEVRKHIAKSLTIKLQKNHANLDLNQAVMERRLGKEYDFNGVLLKDYLLQKAKSGKTHVSVLLLFLLPGSHAGEGGDIAQICNQVKQKYPTMAISISPVVGQNPKLIDLLENRVLDILR